MFTSLESRLPRMNVVESAESLFTMLRAGAGVALLSPLHIQNRREGLSLTRLFEPEVEFTLSIVWDDRSEDLLLHNFLALSRELNEVTSPEATISTMPAPIGMSTAPPNKTKPIGKSCRSI